jgi:hypothetical protein
VRGFGKLYVQIVVGVALGIVLGYAEPLFATSLKPLSDAFIKAIKVMIVPIVFTTVVVGIATMADIRRVGFMTVVFGAALRPIRPPTDADERDAQLARGRPLRSRSRHRVTSTTPRRSQQRLRAQSGRLFPSRRR